MTVAKFRIGTRKSPLALAQAEEVAELLRQAWPHLAVPGAVELVPMMTSGDTFLDRPLADIGGKGLFTKEIEDALLDGRIDIAVHSMKDVQTQLPPGLTIGCILDREDPRDMLVGQGLEKFSDLPEKSIVGTSSLRRAAQLKMYRPDLAIVPFRGNVQTRLAKLDKGEARATLLAMAGLNRLRRWDVPGTPLPLELFLPAVAQGAVGIECRQNDTDTLDILAPLSHVETEIAIACERAFLAALDGSCRTPIAGYAAIHESSIEFRGLIIRPDGTDHHAIALKGGVDDAAALGEHAGKMLAEKAGKDFIAA